MRKFELLRPTAQPGFPRGKKLPLGVVEPLLDDPKGSLREGVAQARYTRGSGAGVVAILDKLQHIP